MRVKTDAAGLNAADLGFLKYLSGLALQPAGNWDGFYRTPADGMNFGLRFQIAFSGYALFALARRTPAYRAPYATALQALIEKMQHPDAWAYWFRGAAHALEAESTAKTKASGPFKTAFEFTTSRLGLGSSVSPDPCQQGNIQYSAHLASLLGFYEMLTGDPRYDRDGFTLTAISGGGRTYDFHYTHTGLAEHITGQMQESHFGGACCEPGRAYAACNNHACISNLLHDRLHGSHLAVVNRRWSDWIMHHMLTGGVKGGLPLPAPNGLLSVAYMSDLHLPIPVSFNLTDAWGLAFMAAWDAKTAHEMYPRFHKRLKSGPGDTLYLGSMRPNESVEISTIGLNTAFAALYAREMGDEPTYQRIKNWADQNLDPVEDADGGRRYRAKPAPYVTALLALAGTLPPEGGGLGSLVGWRPDFETPFLAGVEAGTAVTRAEFAGDTLHIELQGEVGVPVELRFGNFTPHTKLKVLGRDYGVQDLGSLDTAKDQRLLRLVMPAA